MTRQPVKSSHIKSVGYDNGTMTVEYANGSLYQYTGVPEQDYATMLAGYSVGKGLKTVIAKEGVVAQKIEPEIITLEE